MHDFLTKLLSPAWWLSVILVGLMLNLVSAYLKPPLDRTLSRFSRFWRDRSETQRAKRTIMIARLREKPHLQLLVVASESRHRARGVVFLLLSAVSFIAYNAIGTADLVRALGGVDVGEPWHRHVFLGLAALLIFFFMHERAAAERCKALLSEAQEELIEC